MPGTKDANADSVRAARETRWPAQRLLLLAVALALVSLGTLWMSFGTWRQLRALEEAFRDTRPNTFLLGVHLREGAERLTATLLLFALSGDADARDRFDDVAHDLGERLHLTIPLLRSEPEQRLAEAARGQLARFVDEARPRLVKGLRGIRKDTAEQVHGEIAGLAAPLLATATELVRAQRASADAFFGDSLDSMKSLRRWLLVSLLLLVALMSVLAWVTHRTWISPLQARLDATEAAIVRQERLASLGTVAAGVAHEIRNPLTALQFRLFSLRKSLPEEFAQQEDLVIIQREIQRLEQIVKGFLGYARPADPVLAPVTAGQLIADLTALLRTDLGRRGLELAVGAVAEVPVEVDRQQIQQVLINLVLNAADVSPAGSRIQLSVRVATERFIQTPEPAVFFEVADSGPGIPPEIEQQVFDPFFSTKEGGTGLGLPIASRIAEKHGGHVQFQRRPEGGTRFCLVLPIQRNHPDSR